MRRIVAVAVALLAATPAVAQIVPGGGGGSSSAVNTSGTSTARISAPYYLATQGGFQSTPLASPVISSAVGSSNGGTLPATTYYYRVTAIAGSGGETAASSESTVVTTTGATSKITVTWGTVSGAVSYKLYRSGTSNSENYLVTVTAPTVSYVDTGSVAVSTPFYPTVDTSGGFAANGNSITFASGLVSSASPDIYLYLPSNRTSGAPIKVEKQNSGSNGRTSLFNLDLNGALTLGSTLTAGSLFYTGALYVSGGTSAQHRTGGTNSGATVAMQQGNFPTLTASGAKIEGWYPDQFTTLVASIDKDGQGAFNGGVVMGASGAAITASCRATTTNPGSVGAGACVDTSVSCTGAATGAECLVGTPTGGPGANISIGCYVSASGTVQIHACNVDSGGAHTPTAGTYSTRVFNP